MTVQPKRVVVFDQGHCMVSGAILTRRCAQTAHIKAVERRRLTHRLGSDLAGGSPGSVAPALVRSGQAQVNAPSI